MYAFTEEWLLQYFTELYTGGWGSSSVRMIGVKNQIDRIFISTSCL